MIEHRDLNTRNSRCLIILLGCFGPIAHAMPTHLAEMTNRVDKTSHHEVKSGDTNLEFQALKLKNQVSLTKREANQEDSPVKRKDMLENPWRKIAEDMLMKEKELDKELNELSALIAKVEDKSVPLSTDLRTAAASAGASTLTLGSMSLLASSIGLAGIVYVIDKLENATKALVSWKINLAKCLLLSDPGHTVTGKSIIATKLLLASKGPFLAGLGLSAVKKVPNKLLEVAMRLLLAKRNLSLVIQLANIKRLKALAKRKLKAQRDQNRGATLDDKNKSQEPEVKGNSSRTQTKHFVA